MKRKLFEGPARRALAVPAWLAVCTFLQGTAWAQASADQLPTGDQAASIIAGSQSETAEGFAADRFSTIALESAVGSEGGGRWRYDKGSQFGMGRLSSRFGLRTDPLGRGRRMHSGIDLPRPFGAVVNASASGVVVFAGWAGGYGKMVEIDHGGGLVTRYAHLSRIDVPRSGMVTAGQRVGLVGSTGRSTGSHLHYEVRVNGRAVDPLSGRIVKSSWQQGATLSPWIAPEPKPVSQRQYWSTPQGSGSLPQAVIN